MGNLLPTAVDALAEWATGITKNVPVIGNLAICTDSLCTSGCVGINFYCSPKPISKIFFRASCCVFGVLGAHVFNRLSKYTLYMKNVMIGQVTNVTEIAELMS